MEINQQLHQYSFINDSLNTSRKQYVFICKYVCVCMDDAWLFRGRRPSLAKIGDTDALDLLGRWGAWGSPGLLACSLREAYPFFLGCGQKKTGKTCFRAGARPDFCLLLCITQMRHLQRKKLP